MNKQSGTVLLLVLVVIVFISAVATIAVRSSMLALRLSSNHQIQALLLESSDAVLFALEDPQLIDQQFNERGVLGYFNRDDHAQDQLVFCYRAQSTTFIDMQRAGVIRADGSIDPQTTQGFCRADQYATGRATVLSQLYMKKNNTPLSAFSFTPLGSSLGQTAFAPKSEQIAVTVISILPNFSGRSGSEIESCFQRAAQQVMTCFARLNIPFNLQHADYSAGSWLHGRSP